MTAVDGWQVPVLWKQRREVSPLFQLCSQNRPAGGAVEPDQCQAQADAGTSRFNRNHPARFGWLVFTV